MKRINVGILAVTVLFTVFGFVLKNSPDGQAIGLEVGDKAPEIVMNDKDGKTLKLSQLKGYVVLIDFWASWCRPCRMENPTVVAAYEKFKDKKLSGSKGFKVFNVSLDTNKDAWIKAIGDDRLDWPEHVSDLKGWGNEAAKIYGVNSIPNNFLIDAKGIIIGKRLRGPALEAELAKLEK